jgi:hypothetical protein
MDPLSGIRLRDVSLSDVKRLIDDAVPESLHVDYKQELHLDNRDEKKEFLRDITAFANAEGGLLVYGVKEDRDSNGKPNGVPGVAPGTTLSNRDAGILSIEHLLKDGIDERLPSFELQALLVSDSNYIVLIRIPPSLRSPHMVVLGGERRFYIRMNGGKQDMSTAQLRDVVMKTQSIEERVQTFVDNRLERLSALGGGRPYWALHLVPLLRSAGTIDVTQEETIQTLERVLIIGGGRTQHCLEGYKFYQYDANVPFTHALAFRDGAFEFFDQESVSPQDGEKYFASRPVHELVARCLKSGLSIYESGPLVAPLAVCLTFVGLEGYQVFSGFRQEQVTGPAEPISCEPVIVTDAATDANAVLKPFMDVVWNALGRPRCPAYDDNGDYIGYS